MLHLCTRTSTTSVKQWLYITSSNIQKENACFLLKFTKFSVGFCPPQKIAENRILSQEISEKNIIISSCTILATATIVGQGLRITYINTLIGNSLFLIVIHSILMRFLSPSKHIINKILSKETSVKFYFTFSRTIQTANTIVRQWLNII